MAPERTNELLHDKIKNLGFVSSEDSDKPGNLPSLSRVSIVCIEKAKALCH